MVIVLIGYVIDVNLRRKIYKNLLCLLDEKLEVYTYIDKVSQEYTVSKKALYKDFYANNLSVAYFEINEFEKAIFYLNLINTKSKKGYYRKDPVLYYYNYINVLLKSNKKERFLGYMQRYDIDGEGYQSEVWEVTEDENEK